MRFHEFGERSKPVIIMLTGSFCPAKALEYLYTPLSEDYYVIVPNYNGHYKGTNETIRNENECCYTFDFPEIPESMQTRMHFLYGSSEKAYKTCHTLVRKAYPHAKMTVFRGFGHMTYSARHTMKYLGLMREEIAGQNT